ncbi:hypothetical protein MMC13_007126 [Lambiella insularis]|nr:hypothetical protein [Lambiella insularis]
MNDTPLLVRLADELSPDQPQEDRGPPPSDGHPQPRKTSKIKALLSKAKSSVALKTTELPGELPAAFIDTATQTEEDDEITYWNLESSEFRTGSHQEERAVSVDSAPPNDFVAARRGFERYLAKKSAAHQNPRIVIEESVSSPNLNFQAGISEPNTVSQAPGPEHPDHVMAARARLSRLIVEDEKRYFAIDDARRYFKEIQKICHNTKQEVPPFTFLELIGKGSYGRVYKVKDNQKNTLVALKIIDCDLVDFKHSKLRDVTVPEILKEIQILQGLKNQGAKNTQSILAAFAFHSQVWILTEYCPGGSISTLLRAQSPLKEKYIKIIARELAIGMKSFHELGVVHRDIKGANVMIHERGELQIIDFGVAAELATSRDKRTTLIGTPHFMPPELFNDTPGRKLRYGTEVDVWAYGCTLYEMATGFAPGMKSRRMPDFIDLMRNPPRLEDENYSVELREFIAFILKPKVQDRPTMSAVCEHPYIAKSEGEFPTSMLSEMIQSYQEWENRGGVRTSLLNPNVGAAMLQAADFQNDSEEWNFSLTTQGLDDLEMEVTEEDIDEALSQNRDTLQFRRSVNFDRTHQASFHDTQSFRNPYTSAGSPELGFQHSSDYQNDFASSPSSQYSPSTPRGVRDGDLYVTESSLTRRPMPHTASNSTNKGKGKAVEDNMSDTNNGSSNLNDKGKAIDNKMPDNDNTSKGKGKATEYEMANKTPSEAAAIDLDRSLRTGQSAVRGPTWALMGAYDPPTSDLPLRTDDHTSTHHQELQIGAGVGSSTPVPPVNLSSVAQVKANAQNKRQTMEWKFPVKQTAAVNTNAPALPTTRARPQLHHAVTAPVGQVRDDDDDPGTLDLDALMGNDLGDVRASGLYATPSHNPAMDFGNPRDSTTLDLDALMAGDNEEGSISGFGGGESHGFGGEAARGFVEPPQGGPIAGPPTATMTNVGPSSGPIIGRDREGENGQQHHAAVNGNGPMPPLSMPVAPAFASPEGRMEPPPLHSYPTAIYDDNCSREEFGYHFDGALKELEDVLGAWVEADPYGETDESEELDDAEGEEEEGDEEEEAEEEDFHE